MVYKKKKKIEKHLNSLTLLNSYITIIYNGSNIIVSSNIIKFLRTLVGKFLNKIYLIKISSFTKFCLFNNLLFCYNLKEIMKVLCFTELVITFLL